jgi:hypothetical protein
MDQGQPALQLHAPIPSDGLESLDHVTDQLGEGSVVRPSPRAIAASRCNKMQVRDVEGYRATVKYVGSIAGARPEEGWIGVEWDDHSRGKHDGQAYGRRYFTTDPGRGSFVRAEKLVPRLGLDEAVFLKWAAVRFVFAISRVFQFNTHRYMSPQAKSANEVVNVRERAKGKSR